MQRSCADPGAHPSAAPANSDTAALRAVFFIELTLLYATPTGDGKRLPLWACTNEETFVPSA